MVTYACTKLCIIEKRGNIQSESVKDFNILRWKLKKSFLSIQPNEAE